MQFQTRKQQVEQQRRTLLLLNKIVMQKLRENFSLLLKYNQCKHQQGSKKEDRDFITPTKAFNISENTQQILIHSQSLNHISVPRYSELRRLKYWITHDLKNQQNKSTNSELPVLALKCLGTQILETLVKNKQYQYQLLAILRMASHRQLNTRSTPRNDFQQSKIHNRTGFVPNASKIQSTMLNYNSEESTKSLKKYTKQKHQNQANRDLNTYMQEKIFKTEESLISIIESDSVINYISRCLQNPKYLLLITLILQAILVILLSYI